MKERISVGIIGLGGRGAGLMRQCLLPRDDVAVTAVCDLFADRVAAAAEIAAPAGIPAPGGTAAQAWSGKPFTTNDYRELLNLPNIDAVLIATGWVPHIELACEAMKSGKFAAIEVGGAYSVQDCWKLVRTYEQTGTPCMFLENCCYGRYELMAQNMARHGVFGELVHCQGGYRHDLREEVAYGTETRHYRFYEYLHRNCDNYPTHELGPIATMLDINRGNRMLSLVSCASKAAGMDEYMAARKKAPACANTGKQRFIQGDVVTTIIKCARGETITLTLDTTLPRAYSRGFHVQGTKGMYSEDNNSVFLDSEHREYEFDWHGIWGNAERYLEKYEHPVWKAYIAEGVKGGHDGIDWLVISAFIKAVKEGRQPPIDVYDAASWMSVSCLTEDSIAAGGAPVAVPDFTNGRWIRREPWEA